MIIKIEKPNVDDRSEQELAQSILSAILDKCTEVTEFGPTSVTAQLTGAMAFFVGILQFLANRSVQELKTTFMSFLGLERQEASKATCELTFTLQQALDHDFTIRKGQKVQTNTDPAIFYETTEDLTIEEGNLIGSVYAQSVYAGLTQRVQAGALTVLSSPLAYVDTVTNTSSVGGLDSETVDEATTRLQGVLQTHYRAITPLGFEDLAEQVPGVYRAKCWALTDYYAPEFQSPSKCTVVVYPEIGNGDQQLLNAVEAYIDTRRTLGWPVRYILPHWVGIDVSVDVRTDETSLQQVTNNIRSLLNSAFKDWEWRRPITMGEVKSIVLGADGVVSCKMNKPATDFVMGKFNMPKLGELEVTRWQ